MQTGGESRSNRNEFDGVHRGGFPNARHDARKFRTKLETNWRLDHIVLGKAALIAAVRLRKGASMTLIEKIPTMTDVEVVNLLTNARRLHDVGDERQQAAAAELLPALEAAATERKTGRLAAAQAKRAAARKPRPVAA